MLIKDIRILTSDLTATTTFYANVLGLPVVEQTAAHLILQAGSSTITFLPVSGQQPVYHFAFNIPQDQLQDAISWAADKLSLLPVTAGDPIANFSNWNAHAIYFFDNNGNILELIARHDLPNTSDAPFSGKSLLSVSEIGIVTDHPTRLTTTLTKEKGLQVFPKQPPQENFIVMGDDNGLLIIVSTGRNWYPTQRPAGKFFTEIVLQDNNGHQHQLVYNEQSR